MIDITPRNVLAQSEDKEIQIIQHAGWLSLVILGTVCQLFIGTVERDRLKVKTVKEAAKILLIEALEEE